MDHSKEDCYQLIEDYCNGSDGHLTEDIMRDACGLPVRVRQVQEEEEGLGNIMAAGQEQEETVQKYQTLIRKLEDHENSLKQVLATKHGRRLRAKRSVEEDEHEPANQDSVYGRSWSSLKHSRTISYGYSDKIEYTVRARRYTNNDGVQSMSRRLQYHVVDGHTIDLDIQHCCLTLLQQILAEVDPQPPLPDNLLKLLDRLVNDRAGVLKQLGLHIVEGKEMINAVLNGGNPPPTLKNYEIVHDLQRISQYVRWVACNLLHNDYMSLAENKQKTFPSSTILSLLWTSIEDRILQGWTEHVLNNPNKPKHLSLHFDGIRISADHVGSSQDDFIKDCENAIKMRTGFMVKIVGKKAFILHRLGEKQKYSCQFTHKCAWCSTAARL